MIPIFLAGRGFVTPRGHHQFQRPSSAIEAGTSTARTSVASISTSEERLRRFVADASHELRTPVATVRGYAERVVLREAARVLRPGGRFAAAHGGVAAAPPSPTGARFVVDLPRAGLTPAAATPSG